MQWFTYVTCTTTRQKFFLGTLQPEIEAMLELKSRSVDSHDKSVFVEFRWMVFIAKIQLSKWTDKCLLIWDQMIESVNYSIVLSNLNEILNPSYPFS